MRARLHSVPAMNFLAGALRSGRIHRALLAYFKNIWHGSGSQITISFTFQIQRMTATPSLSTTWVALARETAAMYLDNRLIKL